LKNWKQRNRIFNFNYNAYKNPTENSSVGFYVTEQ